MCADHHVHRCRKWLEGSCNQHPWSLPLEPRRQYSSLDRKSNFSDLHIAGCGNGLIYDSEYGQLHLGASGRYIKIAICWYWIHVYGYMNGLACHYDAQEIRISGIGG